MSGHRAQGLYPTGYSKNLKNDTLQNQTPASGPCAAWTSRPTRCDRVRALEVYETVLALRGDDELVEVMRLSDEFKCVDRTASHLESPLAPVPGDPLDPHVFRGASEWGA